MLNDFFFKNIDSRQYAALRMAFGMLAFLTFFGLVQDSTFYYSEDGWFPIALAIKITERREWTILHAFTSAQSVKIFFYVAMGISLCMVAGWRTRLTTWLTFICIVSIQSRNWLNTYGGDAVLRLMIFYLGFSGAGRAWSIDSWWKRFRAGSREIDLQDPKHFIYTERARASRPSAVWPLRMMQLQVCLVYLTTGLCKMHGVEWVQGTAFDLVLMNPTFVRFDYSFLVNNRFTHALLTAAALVTLWWEVGFSFLIWSRYTRWLALTLGLFTHGGIIVFLQIHWFGHIMLSTYLGFVDDTVYKRAVKQCRIWLRQRVRLPRLHLVYDENSRFCRRLALAVGLMDGFKRVQIIPRQSPELWGSLDTGLRGHDIRGTFFVLRKGRAAETDLDAILRLGTIVPQLRVLFWIAAALLAGVVAIPFISIFVLVLQGVPIFGGTVVLALELVIFLIPRVPRGYLAVLVLIPRLISVRFTFKDARSNSIAEGWFRSWMDRQNQAYLAFPPPVQRVRSAS